MQKELPYDWTDMQFRVHNDLRALTTVGRKRRLSTLRKTLLIQSADSKNRWTQLEAAKHCSVTQARINELLRGHISRFSLDSLVNIAMHLGERVHVGLGAV